MVNPYNTQKINKELRNKWKILTNLDKRKVRKIKKQKFPPLEHDKIKKGWKNSNKVKTEKSKNKIFHPLSMIKTKRGGKIQTK